MSAVLPVARIAGIEIRVHLSWAVLVAVITLGLAVQLPAIYPEWSPLLAWATAVVIAVLAFGSIAVHELAHAFMARRLRVPTHVVTLYLFGSGGGFEGPGRGPAQDAVIAVAGPAASLAVGAIGLAIWRATVFAIDPLGSAIAIGAFMVGVFNVVVGLVNLVPGFPLDGGRILRAVIWRFTRSERRATRAVAVVGRTIGLIAVISGLSVALVVSSAEGLVAMLGGWLLTNSARVLDRQLAVQDLIEGQTVNDALERDGLSVPGGLTLDTFAAEAIAQTPGGAVRVIGDVADGSGTPRIVGLIGNTRLRRTARRRWPALRARQVMTPLAELAALRPEDSLWTALDRLQQSRQDALPVIDAEGVAGLATRRSVALAVRAAAERRGWQQRKRRPGLTAERMFRLRGRGGNGQAQGPGDEGGS